MTMARHKRKRHCQPSPALNCPTCQKQFMTKYDLDTHDASEHKGERLICHMCGNRYKSRSGLWRHIQVTHKNKSSYTCTLCGARFNHRIRFTTHMNKHSGIIPYQCHICDKQFSCNDSKLRHIRKCGKNTTKPLITCSICNRTFTRREHLAEHTLNVHGTNQFRCPCGGQYKWAKSLRRHQKRCEIFNN